MHRDFDDVWKWRLKVALIQKLHVRVENLDAKSNYFPYKNVQRLQSKSILMDQLGDLHRVHLAANLFDVLLTKKINQQN